MQRWACTPRLTEEKDTDRTVESQKRFSVLIEEKCSKCGQVIAEEKTLIPIVKDDLK